MHGLTKDVIASTNPDDLAEEAWNSVPLPAEPDNFAAAVRQLPRHWRVAQTTYTLFLEVQNGGLHQFFWNSHGDLLDETQEDLQQIGATPYLEFFTQARAVYEAHNYAQEREASGNSWEGFTAGYRDNRLEELDTAFYQQDGTKSLPAYLGEFVKAQSELFAS